MMNPCGALVSASASTMLHGACLDQVDEMFGPHLGGRPLVAFAEPVKRLRDLDYQAIDLVRNNSRYCS